MLKGALREVVITPPLGVSIPGYFENRLSAGVKDELHAKALAVSDGESDALIIAVDAVGLYASDVAAIRRRVAEFTGISPQQIMVSATHIHTGPPVANTFENRRDDDYCAYMTRKTADAAIEAYRQMAPCRIGAGRGEERGISFNRRYFMKDGTVRTNPGFNNPDTVKPAGPIDPEVAVLRIEDLQGRPLGAIVNFACHPDVVGGAQYSADYPGELSRVLKKAYGEQFVTLFLLGTCGNINHIDVRRKEGPEHYKKMGRILAGEVQKVWEKIQPQEDATVAAAGTEITVRTRNISPAQLEQARRAADDQSLPAIERIYARELLEYVKIVHTEEEAEVSGIRVGPLAIACLPAEVFVELGLEIKSRSLLPVTMIATQTNGRFGYIPTREAFAQGGYEPRTTRMNRLVPEAGEQFTAAAQAVLAQLAQSYKEGEA